VLSRFPKWRLDPIVAEPPSPTVIILWCICFILVSFRINRLLLGYIGGPLHINAPCLSFATAIFAVVIIIRCELLSLSASLSSLAVVTRLLSSLTAARLFLVRRIFLYWFTGRRTLWTRHFAVVSSLTGVTLVAL